MPELDWVEQVQTVDATDNTVVQALDANPGWKLLAVGVGMGGQTTLTYGWPWRGTVEIAVRVATYTKVKEVLYLALAEARDGAVAERALNSGSIAAQADALMKAGLIRA